MVDFATDSLTDIARHIVADGKIDAEEVAALEARLRADNEIDEDEAEALFTINDIVTEQGNAPEYADLFVRAIVDFVLGDKMSPNRLDDYEWTWLRDRIGEDFQLDTVETKLLTAIAERAESVPEDFYEFASRFEEKEYDVADRGSTFLPARLIKGLASKVRKVTGA